MLAKNDLAVPNVRPIAGAIQRNAGLDALRAAVTLLVVFHHCAITYGAIGGWYYHEIAPSRSAGSILLILFCTVNQAFFMGLFFLLAGYFTPPALARKGATRFVIARLLRLGLPLLFYGLVLGPATIALAQTSRGRPFFGTLERLWKRGTFENGPMWFAQAFPPYDACFVPDQLGSRWRGSGHGRGGFCPAVGMACRHQCVGASAGLFRKLHCPVRSGNSCGKRALARALAQASGALLVVSDAFDFTDLAFGGTPERSIPKIAVQSPVCRLRFLGTVRRVGHDPISDPSLPDAFSDAGRG